MNIISKKARLSGSVVVPGSKSHTIRALILATLADGTSHIKNPLPSADCLSTAAAVPLIGADVNLNLSTEGEPGTEWTVNGAGKDLHLPDDVVNVGNSGTLLYFLSPIAATFAGDSVFTGDSSIRKRPVLHVIDAVNQLSEKESFVTRPGTNGCPMVIRGPIKSGTVKTEGEISSQYVSGLMIAGMLLEGGIRLSLSNPKETPYLTMTQKWLESVGVECTISDDFKEIEVKENRHPKAFSTTIPSDWEGVAFPLVAALIADDGTEITIENIDGSGTQGDDAIVGILKSIGGEIEWNRDERTLRVKKSRLTTEHLPGGELHVKMSPFPDAICALAVAACFTEGTTILEDAEVCRRKETDRLSVLTKELSALGADIEEKKDALIIRGHSPILPDGSKNPAFALHGGITRSYDDHRMAMSLACMGLGLPDGAKIIVQNAECCSVSFPHFFDVMNSIGASFSE